MLPGAVPPTDRFVITFAAEPPQEGLPYGRWAETLREHFQSPSARIDTEGAELGEAGEIRWFPDRSFAGRTYIPAVARTTEGFELFGFVRSPRGSAGPATSRAGRLHLGGGGVQPRVEARPQRRRDRHVAGRGWQDGGHDARLGRAVVPGGAIVTAELANLAVDQCELVDERFTLIAPDNYRGDFLEVKLWGRRGDELAAESLYVDDDEERIGRVGLRDADADGVGAA